MAIFWARNAYACVVVRTAKQKPSNKALTALSNYIHTTFTLHECDKEKTFEPTPWLFCCGNSALRPLARF